MKKVRYLASSGEEIRFLVNDDIYSSTKYASKMVYLAAPYSYVPGAIWASISEILPGFIFSRLLYLYSEWVMFKRFRQITKTAGRLQTGMEDNWVVFSPITHSHSMAKLHNLPRDWRFWERIDRIFISRSDVLYVLMLPGWEKSRGVAAEINIADELGLEVRYITPELKVVDMKT